MSSISAQIATSAIQATVQQRQVAQARDSVRKAASLQAQRLREQLDQHLHEVQNMTAPDTQDVKIHDEERQRQGKKQPHTPDPEDEASSETTPPTEGGHLDILA